MTLENENFPTEAQVEVAARAIMEVEGWLEFNAETVVLMWAVARRDAVAALNTLKAVSSGKGIGSGVSLSELL